MWTVDNVGVVEDDDDEVVRDVRDYVTLAYHSPLHSAHLYSLYTTLSNNQSRKIHGNMVLKMPF